MADAQSDARTHELSDILVEEVSLVDAPANKRRFLIVKRSDGSIAMEKQDQAAAPDGTVTQGEGAAQAKAELSIPKPVKAAVERTLTEVVEVAQSLLAAVKDASETDEQMDAPMPPMIGEAAAKLSQLLAAMTEHYPSPKAGQAPSEKAESTVGAQPVGKRAPDEERTALAKAQHLADSLAKRVADLEHERAEREHARIQKSLVDAGKLPPSLAVWAKSQTAEQLAAWGEGAPVVFGPKLTSKAAPGGAVSVDDEARHVLRMIGGVTPDQYAATRKARAERSE